MLLLSFAAMPTARSPLARLLLRLLLLVGVVALVSCTPARRGGSDDDDDAGDDDDDDDDGLTEVPDSQHCAPVADWDPSWSALEWRILELTNAVRAQGANCGGEDYPPVPPLVMQEHLRCSSRLHSVDMLERDFFEHVNPDGVGPGQRITDAGYNWMGFGENIGWGSASAEGMMEGWVGSPGHCSNIMTDWFTELGVGFFADGGDVTWTQNFGDR